MIEEEPVFAFPGVAWDWTSIGGYREAVARARPATNVTTFVGHNTLRRFVIGGANRPPTAGRARADALARPRGDRRGRARLHDRPVVRARPVRLGRGARGPGGGRRRTRPARTTPTCATATSTSAARSPRRSRPPNEPGSILNISHMYPRANQPLEEADDPAGHARRRPGARARGDLRPDDVPARRRRLGPVAAGLGARRRARRRRWRSSAIPASRARLIDELSSPADFWLDDWDDQVICKVNRPENAHLSGRTIGEIARERGQAPIDTALDLVLEDGQFWIAPTIKDQGHLDRLVASPLCVPIGDGFANHPEKHRAYGLMPKSFGTFPLVLGSYVRDRGVLTLEEGDPQDHRRTRPTPRARRSGDARRRAGRRPRGVRSGDHRRTGRPRRTRRRAPRGSSG